MFVIGYETKAQRKRGIRMMRKSCNRLLKAVEQGQLPYEDDEILLEDYGYYARVKTEGGFPDTEFAALHELLHDAVVQARGIKLDPAA